MKPIKYTNKELYEMQVTGSEAEKYYANKPLTKKQKKEMEWEIEHLGCRHYPMCDDVGGCGEW